MAVCTCGSSGMTRCTSIKKKKKGGGRKKKNMDKRSVGARTLRIRRYRSLLFTRNSFHDNCSNRVVPRDASYVETKLVCLFTYGCTRSPPACMYAVFKFARAHARTGNITFAAEMEQRTRKKEKTSLGKNIHIYT